MAGRRGWGGVDWWGVEEWVLGFGEGGVRSACITIFVRFELAKEDNRSKKYRYFERKRGI
jgi:hypothetical protein